MDEVREGLPFLLSFGLDPEQVGHKITWAGARLAPVERNLDLLGEGNGGHPGKPAKRPLTTAAATSPSIKNLHLSVAPEPYPNDSTV